MITRRSLMPIEMQACTNSRLRNARNSPRTRRAIGGHDTIAMAMMTLPIDGLRIATTRMAKMKDGMVWKISVSRISDFVDACRRNSRRAPPISTPTQRREQRGDEPDDERRARAVDDAGQPRRDPACRCRADTGPNGGRNGCPASSNGLAWMHERAHDRNDDDRDQDQQPGQRPRDCARSGGRNASASVRIIEADARVEQRIDDVDQDIDDDDEAGRDEKDSEQQIEVAREQRPEREEPDAGPAEHRLDDNRAADLRADWRTPVCPVLVRFDRARFRFVTYIVSVA